jgi:pre-mRNA branch site protein p14
MSTSAGSSAGTAAQRKRLAPEVNRILYVRNLPFKITGEEMYDIFGKYGAVRQIRIGTGKDTKGTAFVVYEDIYDAKSACEHLSGFNVLGRYLIVLYWQPTKMTRKMDLEKKQEELQKLKAQFGIGTSSVAAPPSSSE